MARAVQPVSIDGIEFDALIEETQSLAADLPTYPVESGFEVSDSIILKPLTLSMTLFLTNTPVTWKGRHGANPARVQNVLRQLEELYFSRKPVTVSTSSKTYKSMAILSIELTKTKETGPSREIPISFQEIRVVEAKTTTIPDSYGKGGATGTNAGTASVKTNDTSKANATSSPAQKQEQSASEPGSLGYSGGKALAEKGFDIFGIFGE